MQRDAGRRASRGPIHQSSAGLPELDKLIGDEELSDVACTAYRSVHLVCKALSGILIHRGEAFVHNAANGSFHGSQNKRGLGRGMELHVITTWDEQSHDLLELCTSVRMFSISFIFLLFFFATNTLYCTGVDFVSLQEYKKVTCRLAFRHPVHQSLEISDTTIT